MFKITSTRPVEWPSFVLRKGVNELASRKAVPVELWPKLARFRDLGILSFDGEAKVGPNDGPKLDGLNQAQLYALSKDQLIELAKAEGMTVTDSTRKSELLAELEQFLPQPAKSAGG